MAMQTRRMMCPKCSTEMNHHADKLVDPVKADDQRYLYSVLGGIIEEMHYCPRCGAVESRRAE